MPIGRAPFVRSSLWIVSFRLEAYLQTYVAQTPAIAESPLLIRARADSICTGKRAERIVHACGCIRLSRISSTIFVLAAKTVAFSSCPQMQLSRLSFELRSLEIFESCWEIFLVYVCSIWHKRELSFLGVIFFRLQSYSIYYIYSILFNPIIYVRYYERGVAFWMRGCWTLVEIIQ